MDAEYCYNRWETNEIAFYASDAHSYLAHPLSLMELEASSRVFVPLCGKSIDLAWIASKRHRVVGAELNRSVVHECVATANTDYELDSVGAPLRERTESFDFYVVGIFRI